MPPAYSWDTREHRPASAMVMRMPPEPTNSQPSPSLPALLTAILPPKVLHEIERCLPGGTPNLEEIRLRAGCTASLTVNGSNVMTALIMTSRELLILLTQMCGGSLYAYSDQINRGFLSFPGGVRVGVAGHASCEDGRVIGLTEITSLCIRLPHSHRPMGRKIVELLQILEGECGTPRGILIYAPPGVGKTTLLRGTAAELAGGDAPRRTVVIDTRGELTLAGDTRPLCLDVLTGYPRPLGVDIATRTLGAQVIVCDEIGDVDEAVALTAAQGGGVPLVATAHAGTVSELLHRSGIRLLHDARLFGAYVGIRRDGKGDFIYQTTLWRDANRDL